MSSETWVTTDLNLLQTAIGPTYAVRGAILTRPGQS